MKYTLSIVIPVYNEEAGIKSTLKNLVPILNKTFSDYEIIFVESGSTDKSAEIADKAAKRNKKIKVIHQGMKKGYGNALREGLRNCKYDLTMYTDCDNPFDFIYIKKALRYFSNYDAVIGYRLGKRETFGRLILSRGANLLENILFRLNVKEVNYPFKIIKTKLVKKMNLLSNNSFIAAEILMELKKKKARIKQIQIPTKLRMEGESKFMDLRKLILDHLKDATRCLLLKKFKNRF
jgi:glycosyltransferase involved in cell wall biosynthesis